VTPWHRLWQARASLSWQVHASFAVKNKPRDCCIQSNGPREIRSDSMTARLSRIPRFYVLALSRMIDLALHPYIFISLVWKFHPNGSGEIRAHFFDHYELSLSSSKFMLLNSGLVTFYDACFYRFLTHLFAVVPDLLGTRISILVIIIKVESYFLAVFSSYVSGSGLLPRF
jgi:hypothetical protein